MNVRKALVAYFTGTGGTARVAAEFEKNLKEKGMQVKMHEIKTGRLIDNGDEDLLILLFAVHAANAPLPVYQWLEILKRGRGIPAVVISVSAGGEVTPNTACRVSSIKRLEKKGYAVIYEETVVMPSNIFVATPEETALRLLEVLPQKTERIIGEVLSGVIRRVRPRLIDSFLSVIFEIEKWNTRHFGKRLCTDEKCTGCGWCRDKCPSGNIEMKGGLPVFDNKCVMCFACIYGCPAGAIQPKVFRFGILKEGFNLAALEKKAGKNGAKALPRGALWKGVRKYLENDGQRV